MSRPVHVLATFQAHPGKEKDAEAMLEGLVDPTHHEEGCVCYILQRRIDRPGTFYMIETWRSTVDFRKHLASAHLSAVMARKDELFALLDIAFVAPAAAGNPAKSQYSLYSDDHPAKKISD
jgi:quinol monooxygenase YgiN